ncbi:MAG: hypothetical protein AB1478_11950 [Nitrospirota bacterium]
MDCKDCIYGKVGGGLCPSCIEGEFFLPAEEYLERRLQETIE